MFREHATHPVTRTIRALWPERLQHGTVGADTALSELGFDSLELIQLFAELESRLGIALEQLERLVQEQPITVGSLLMLENQRGGAAC